jgi:hypothetical protein
MAGLVPAIHAAPFAPVLPALQHWIGMDGRDKPGHDG